MLLTLLAAVCFGVSSVLQHHGANRVRRRFPLHPGLLVDLARQPLWLVGIVADIAGVSLHLVAVNVGELSVVQPLLTVGLVVALPLQAFLGRPPSRRSLLAAVLIVLGLAVFLAVRPAAVAVGPHTFHDWVPALVLVGAVALVAAGVALTRHGRVRAFGLGAAAGALFALSAALVKTWGSLLAAGGLTGLAVSWQLWAALGCGLLGALLSQAAFQAGSLGLPLAAMMVTDPVVGVSLGVAVYGEPFSTGPLAVVQAAGLALTLAGVWLLATAESRTDSARASAGRVSGEAEMNGAKPHRALQPGYPTRPQRPRPDRWLPASRSRWLPAYRSAELTGRGRRKSS
ncbi:MAG: DMT family transporter [Pseudonocardiaceae bacterium]